MIPKINMRTAKNGSYLSLSNIIMSQLTKHFVLFFWIMVHLVPFAEQNGTNVFFETSTDAQRKKIVVREGVRTFKFVDGNKLNTLYKVTLPCVIVDSEVSINTIVDSDIPLLLSKDSMKRAGTCLNFENDNIMMFKKKIPLRCTSSGHYHISTTKPLPDKSKFKHTFH